MSIGRIPDWLHHQATLRPHHLAVDDGIRQVSFQALDREVGRLGARLIAEGVRAGDRVVLVARPHVASLALIHAVIRQQAILVPLDPNLPLSDFKTRIADVDPKLVISDGSARDPVPHAVRLDQLARDSDEAGNPNLLDLDRVAVLVYTSGTTGRPKAAELRLRHFFSSALFGGLHMGIQADDCWLFVMPLFHVSGLSIIFRSVVHGSSIRIRVPFSPSTARAALQQGGITLASWVPTMLWRLLGEGLTGDDTPSLRMILLGGAPASPDLITESRRRGIPVVPTYGLTETCSQVVTGVLDDDNPVPRSSAGVPIFPTQIRIVEASGADALPEQPGEIWVRGPTVFSGYWRNPEASANSLTADGWLRTHDLGWMSQEGRLTVIDRLGDLIIRGGENVAPTEVENALLGFPGIQDVAVIGIADPEWGEIVAAVVVSQTTIRPQILTNFLQMRLPRYKIPTVYFQTDALPRTPSGKVQRRRVREQIQSQAWIPLQDEKED